MVLALSGNPPNSAVAVNAAVNAELAANWTPLALGAGAPFRNYLLNGQFNVLQRGSGPWTATTFGPDRWNIQINGDSASAVITGLADADRTAIGDEAAEYGLLYAVTGASTSGNYTVFVQNTEDVRRLSNKTVTLSFWAKASAAVSLGVRAYQYFGTGGTPSAEIIVGPYAFSLTTSWARYSQTFTFASASGKTLGTNTDHSTGVEFALSSGTANASAFGVGAQSATFTFWGLQLEVGASASPVEKRPVGIELALCQRYYQAGFLAGESYQAAGYVMLIASALPVAMRATPTATITTNTSSNIGTPTIASNGGTTVQIAGTVSASAQTNIICNYTLSADL